MMAILDRPIFLYRWTNPSAVEKSTLFSMSFKARMGKRWFSHEMLFAAVLRLRGMEANASSGYAEGFYCRKANLKLEV